MVPIPPPITRDDCSQVIAKLTEIVAAPDLDASLLVYGSYVNNWRTGISDLDAMICFSQPPFYDCSTYPHWQKLRQQCSHLAAQLPPQFFADVFILDMHFGVDGRFLVFDEGFIRRMTNGCDARQTIHTETETKYQYVFGTPFLEQLQPVHLRHQDEFELAAALYQLRNVGLFELSNSLSTDSHLQHTIFKCFKILPRNVGCILENTLLRTPAELQCFRPYLQAIDYEPLTELWQAFDNPKNQADILQQWHEYPETYWRCLACFESTLRALIEHEPMQSRRREKGGVLCN